ncbi:hypothetical protein MMC22_008823 [Lobaria immixta]|nr:hypothetical protein [Lobaria immixta]
MGSHKYSGVDDIMHVTIIVDNWLFIDGGDVAYRANSVSEWSYDRDNVTYGIDLSRDWTNSTLSLVKTTRPSDAVALTSESLWFDDKHKLIYCFGGLKSFANRDLNYLAAPSESIWGFEPNDEGNARWYQVMGPVSTTPFPPNVHRQARGISVSDGKRAYYLGGYFSKATSPSAESGDPIPSPGLLIFDFNTLTITNSSDVLPSGRDIQDFAFNNITLYDKKNETWYFQTASGDIPQPRTDFCVVGVEGDEKVSFEIFMHGGVINNVFGSQASHSDQVYILSLPSFRWFRANYTSAYSRSGHTCHVTNSQMIMIGGQDPTYCSQFQGDGDATQAPADPWLKGIGVFDMNALRFKDSYQADARAYETSDVIKNYYTTGSTIPTSRSQHLSHGTMAGIALGCIAFIIVSVVIAAIFTKKRNSKSVRALELSSRSPQTFPSEPQLIELSAEQRAQGILTVRQDLTELPHTSRVIVWELSSGTPELPG